MTNAGMSEATKISTLIDEFEGVDKDAAMVTLQACGGNLEFARNMLIQNGRKRKQKQIANAPHNPTSTTGGKTADEIELEKAIALSLQDSTGGGDAVDPNVDPELAQALLLSKQESGLSGANRPPVIDLTGESGGDELQATLLASIQTAQGRAPIVTNDPATLARQGDLPVGLKNVGNTCYLNSLIQTYFMIPVLRKAVISYAPVVPVEETNPNHAFMLELQRLFGAMVLSNQRFVDPSNLLKKIVDDQGKPVTIGAQEDVSEFNDIFMTRLTKGLDLVHPPPEGAVPNPLTVSSSAHLADTELTNGRLQRMFQPSVMEVLKSQEPDGTPIDQSHTIDFGRNFILPVNEETDLFSSLDQFMFDDVADWETPSGAKAPAHRWKWLRHAPEVLFFQQQRATWSGEGNMKLNHKLKFPEVLHMDRYDLANSAAVSAIRSQNVQRRAQIAELAKQIEPFLNFESGTHLEVVLAGAIRYLETLVQQQKPGMADQIDLMTRSVEMLRNCKEEEAAKLAALQSEKAVLEETLEKSYAEFNSEPYRLFAVWVHAGAAVGGHYWAYIKDVQSDDWYKLNDTDSNRVDLQKVLEDGFGGQGVTSAYFLIYMKDSLYQRCKRLPDKAAGMPEALKTSLETSNAEFEKKLKEHRENGLDGKMERFVTQYKNKLQQTSEYAHKFTVEKDMRYYSVFAYLLSIGMEEDMQAAVASEMWLRTFGSGIGKSQDTVQFEKLVTQAVPGTSVLFKAVSLNENDADRKRRTEWDTNHHAFRSIFMFVNAALQLLTKPHPVTNGLTDRQDAMRHLVIAYTRNQKVPHEITKRRDLEDLLRLSIVACLQEAIECATSNLLVTLSVLEDVTYVALKFPDVIGESIKAVILDATFSAIPEKNPAFVEEPRTAVLQERLINGEVPSDTKWESYSVPKMPSELAEWETLINSSRDTYENLKRKYCGLLPSFNLPELRICLSPVAISSSTPTNTSAPTTEQNTAVQDDSKMDISPDALPETVPLSQALPSSDASNNPPPSSQDTPHMSAVFHGIKMDVGSGPSSMDVDDPNKS
jgi:ubiquitin carboxyl-terminal hydrolase 25/28